jgi:hypothetical protein
MVGIRIGWEIFLGRPICEYGAQVKEGVKSRRQILRRWTDGKSPALLWMIPLPAENLLRRGREDYAWDPFVEVVLMADRFQKLVFRAMAVSQVEQQKVAWQVGPFRIHELRFDPSHAPSCREWC